MPRIALDLNKAEDRSKVGGTPWRRAIGYDPSLPNAGVALETPASSARLPDFDDSGWDVCDDVRQFVSSGFTFGWYRIAVEIPAELEGQSMAGAMMPFPDRAGAASSLLGVSQMLCAALSGVIVGHMLGTSAWPVAVPLAIAGVLTLLLWVLTRGARARDGGHH